jgi:putative transcriptional regulator
MTNASSSFKNHFLVAMPGLNDSIFAHSLTYICEHNENGAMGIVINHPLDISIDDIFSYLEIQGTPGEHKEAIMAGGPVDSNRGFVLHRSGGDWEASMAITSELSLTSSLDILDAIAHNTGPKDSLIALGYAGWGAGQLEEEIANNAWLTLPADSRIIFDTPCELRLKAATEQLGIDWCLIAPTAGHA